MCGREERTNDNSCQKSSRNHLVKWNTFCKFENPIHDRKFRDTYLPVNQFEIQGLHCHVIRLHPLQCFASSHKKISTDPHHGAI